MKVFSYTHCYRQNKKRHILINSLYKLDRDQNRCSCARFED